MSESFWDKERPPHKGPKKIYLSDPSDGVIEAVESLGWEVFKAESTGKKAFANNIKELFNCDVVLAKTDNPTPNSCWAIGLAVGIGKTMIGIGTRNDNDNMVNHSCYTVESVPELVKSLKALYG